MKKIALVTGASRGIGKAAALALARDGWTVHVNYIQSRAAAEAVAAQTGGMAICADVSDGQAVEAMFEKIEPVDLLVNNAGVYKFQPIEEVTEDEFHRQFNINVLGTILATREAMKHFGNNGGSVINITSVASGNAVPTASVYSATKGALESVTRVLAAELGSRNIRVNSIAPGGVETEGLHATGIKGSDFEQQMIDQTPLGRLGQPDDIAKVAVFLASDDSAWMTGERVQVSGGLR